MSGLVILSALVVLSPEVGPPRDPAWMVNVGLSNTEVSQRTKALEAKGYRPIAISAYNSVEANRFAVVYLKGGGPAWEMNWGLTTDQFLEKARALRAKGYIPECLSGCNEIGAERLSYLWVKSAKPERDWSYGLDVNGLLRQIGRMRALGYRPVKISSYMVDAANVYAVVWEKNDMAWELKYGMTAQEFQNALDDLSARGYRPVSVSGLGTSGVVRYCAIWEKRKGPAWEVRYGQSQGVFLDSARSLGARTYRPTVVSGYNTLDGDRFASIWEKE
jgi:hypothetical protein